MSAPVAVPWSTTWPRRRAATDVARRVAFAASAALVCALVVAFAPAPEVDDARVARVLCRSLAAQCDARCVERRSCRTPRRSDLAVRRSYGACVAACVPDRCEAPPSSR